METMIVSLVLAFISALVVAVVILSKKLNNCNAVIVDLCKKNRDLEMQVCDLTTKRITSYWKGERCKPRFTPSA